MAMSGHKRQCKTRRLGIGQDIGEPIQKINPVAVIKKNSAIDSLHNDVVQSAWGV